MDDRVGERVKIMMNINVNGKEYKVEFSFGATECKEIVQKMFSVVNGSYFSQTDKSVAQASFDGLANMTADVPEICILAIYAGCIDNNPVTMDEAKKLTRAYITEKRKKQIRVTDIEHCLKKSRKRWKMMVFSS